MCSSDLCAVLAVLVSVSASRRWDEVMRVLICLSICVFFYACDEFMVR